jgi:very-short-patch-repair endonuclease
MWITRDEVGDGRQSVGMLWTDIARRQGGLITRRQLAATGIRASSVDSLLSVRRLEPTGATGVYRAGGAPATHSAQAWFGVLSTRSPLSYVSAAAWWDIPVPADGLVHITRLDRRRLDWPPGVRVHRVGLEATDVTQVLGLPITTRPETVLDCMGWLRIASARRLADRAVQQRWITREDVIRRLERQSGRWGNRQLRRLLPTLGDGAAAESERRMHQLLRRAGIRGWVANYSVTVAGHRYEIDVALPERRIAIEVDGYRYHSDDNRFQADRTKQNALLSSGWSVLRFTWADIEERPGYVVTQIRSLLAA